MRNVCLILVIFCSTCSTLIAQTDSSWIDLGRIKLKKEFTQTITVKGKDLEQMPFANLNDALSVWFNGWNEWMAGGTVLYVVDGNVMTNADAYSIYDIEEITLVQNALIQLNGATREKQLVLITTRRDHSKPSGITVAGASFAVTNSKRRSEKQSSETNFYHQYYLSAWQSRNKIQYGITAGYLRDVAPYIKDLYDVQKPNQLNRFRFHGYLNYTMNSANELWLRAGFVPGKLTDKWSYTTSGLNGRYITRESYLTTEARWRSRISKQLTNELSAGYTPATARGDANWQNYNPYIPSPNGQDETRTFKNTVNNLLITDHLAYHVTSGNWQFDPSVDLSFRNMYARFKMENNTYKRNTDTLTSTIFTDYDTNNNSFLLTPAVNMTYKNQFNVQVGLVYNMSRQPDSGEARKVLPFVTFGIDVFKLLHIRSGATWMINWSYAPAGHYLEAYYNLYNLYPDAEASPMVYNNVNKPSDFLYGGDTRNDMWQLGTSLRSRSNRFQISYNFSRSTYSDTGVYHHRVTGPNQPATTTIKMGNFLNIHRLGITVKTIESANFHWLTAWHVSVVETKINHQDGPEGWNRGIDVNVPEEMVTGGWVNRVQYKRFMLGLDLLYAGGHKQFIRTDQGNDADFSLRNIYAGYQFQVNNRSFDVYAECRNPGQAKENNFPDRRNYFGLGFKAGL